MNDKIDSNGLEKMIRTPSINRGAYTTALAALINLTTATALYPQEDSPPPQTEEANIIENDHNQRNDHEDFNERAINFEFEDVSTLLRDPEDKFPLSVSVGTDFHSRYLTTDGFFLSDGSVNQSSIALSIGDIIETGDAIELYGWSNFDLKLGSLTEVDVGLDYSIPLADDFLFGTVNGSIGFALYDFPDESIADNHLSLLIGELEYKGPVDIGLTVRQFLNSGVGREYILSLSKGLELDKIFDDIVFTLTPSIGTAYMHDAFGYDGFSNIQYGVGFNIKKGNFNLDLSIKQQIGLLDDFDDEVVLGIGLGFEH